MFRSIKDMFEGNEDDEIIVPAGQYPISDQGRDYSYYHPGFPIPILSVHAGC